MCLHCGAESIKKFCSRSCFLYYRKTNTKIYICVCKNCGKHFVSKKYGEQARGQKHCSKACHTKSQRGVRSNKNKVIISEKGKRKLSVLLRERRSLQEIFGIKCFWKGGVTPLRNKLRTCDKYKTWRNSIFLRDGWRCQSCLRAGGTLNAHHLIPFSEIVKDKTEASLMKDSSPLWSLFNGVTLCMGCHRKTFERWRS